MTVRELIEALRSADQDAEVVTEGCDCLGDVGAVEPMAHFEGKRAVLLKRAT